MQYLWDEFSIKTFPAETIVFRDGVFMPELSTLPNSLKITKKHDLPVHIICVGEIAGLFDINCEISAPDATVFLTVKTTNKKPAFLNVFIKNTGKNSVFNGKILVQNYGVLEINEKAGHFAEKAGVFLNNKIVAHAGSESKLYGAAEIAQGCESCESDIGFTALAAPDAKIQFSPAQRIGAAPSSAAHSASIWRESNAQVEYLRTAGLSGSEIKKVLTEAFTNDNF
ncbi:MAG: SufD family Fe-S cluster assembly protein [Alphaproteobacteria bacterium]|nr:SufD family Fe-S cluster assembly protein [Alphaproteobacteria bacterium]